LIEAVQAETWSPFGNKVEVRDQRSDNVYFAVVPEHVHEGIPVDPDWFKDREDAIDDFNSINEEIAQIEQQYS